MIEWAKVNGFDNYSVTGGRKKKMKGGETMSRHNLYMFRCDRKLTKGEMAVKTGVSRMTYTYIENGKRGGSQEFWNRVQQEFNVPDSDMYSLMKLTERTEQCEETTEKSQ